jgi:hypothetical protein
MSEYGFSDDETAASEEELLDEIGEGEPGPRPDDAGAGGEEPAAR